VYVLRSLSLAFLLLSRFEGLEEGGDCDVGFYLVRSAAWEKGYEQKCWRQMGQDRVFLVALSRQLRQKVCPQGMVVGR
jgi:hypothetical protein